MCATQWTIYMSLVTQETDPGDGPRLRRVIIPPPPAPVLMIRASFISQPEQGAASGHFIPTTLKENCCFTLGPVTSQGKCSTKFRMAL